MYLGPFYFQKRDFFILLAVLLLAGSIYYSVPFPLFNPYHLLPLFVLFLFTKASILPAHDPAVFITFFTAIILTLFLPLFQIVLFLMTAFILQRVFRVY